MAYGKLNNRPIETELGQTLLSVLARHGEVLDAPCGGKHTCGKCKVKAGGMLSEMGEKERSFLTEKEISDGIRLACFCKIEGEFYLENKSNGFEIETETGALNITISPSVDAAAFGKKHKNAVGMAVDIGTTTVVASFYDLLSGKHLFTTSSINAQKTYGADVMSRIEYAIDHENGDETLHGAIISQLNGMIGEFSQSSGISSDAIAEIVIAGNTTMELLAAGYSVKSLGAVPFEPESYLGESISCEVLGMNAKNASVYFLPCCGGFFGGDAVACMVVTHFEDDGVKYMTDIGTNGEMAINNGGEIFGCSTAAGPAFEGACIRFGTGSIKGAINGVKEDENGGFVFQTIANEPPSGICGSGMIDLIAAGLRLGYIDETGRIDDEVDAYGSGIVEFEDDPAIRLTDEIYLTQKDIREIQLAKSAICAGTIVLSKKSKTLPKVYIAGGFGSAIHLDSAAKIGLLPPEFCENAEAIGNAALKGAVMCLLSTDSRRTAHEISKKVNIIDLSVDPVFQDEYVANMIFE